MSWVMPVDILLRSAPEGHLQFLHVENVTFTRSELSGFSSRCKTTELDGVLQLLMCMMGNAVVIERQRLTSAFRGGRSPYHRHCENSGFWTNRCGGW